MKIGAATAALLALAFVAIPPVRHRLGGGADAQTQTRPAHGLDPAVVPPLVIGMNTGGPAYYTSEDAFADSIKSHGTLIYLDSPSGDLTTQLKRDDGGHPIEVPINTHLATRIHDGLAPLLPGTYRCTISPGWRVEGYLGSTVSQSGTKFTVASKSDHGSVIAIQLVSTINNAALTDLSCHTPGVAADATFRPDFLSDMRPFRVIRFMDWMNTNNLAPQSWATRATPGSLNQIEKGVALEHMVELANTLHADPWFTLPWDAEEGYYRNFATYVRDHLDPGLKAYVELSNETWNVAFAQARDATEKGKQRYPGVTDDQANDYYYADRVRDLMAVWSDVYKGQEKRIVRVMASQPWPVRGEQRLSHKDSWKYVDALAIAPYWGDVPFGLPGSGKPWRDALFTKAQGAIAEAVQAGRQNKAIANRYGLPLITYEGGPGFIAFEPQMVKELQAFEADPRMYDLYQGFLRDWQKQVGGLLVLYQSTADTFYGHERYTGQPVSEAVKMRAVVDFIHALPQDAGKPAP